MVVLKADYYSNHSNQKLRVTKETHRGQGSGPAGSHISKWSCSRQAHHSALSLTIRRGPRSKTVRLRYTRGSDPFIFTPNFPFFSSFLPHSSTDSATCFPCDKKIKDRKQSTCLTTTTTASSPPKGSLAGTSAL